VVPTNSARCLPTRRAGSFFARDTARATELLCGLVRVTFVDVPAFALRLVDFSTIDRGADSSCCEIVSAGLDDSFFGLTTSVAKSSLAGGGGRLAASSAIGVGLGTAESAGIREDDAANSLSESVCAGPCSGGATSAGVGSAAGVAGSIAPVTASSEEDFGSEALVAAIRSA